MLERRRDNCKKVFAVLVVAILLVTMLFAASLITKNSDHDCVGDHCPVCECIQVCEAVIHQMGAGLLPVISFVLTMIAACVAASNFFAEFLPQSLLTLKIRLNI